ncbi:uncharacterized protein BDR25DRAFT_266666 [Lindgomyces ingoldianus]|uniref:Uncharacterized protein n=1 Tax=Lindgomyces ingoldianus TaxID=673940 RepID=A0ACB6QNJ7_9PLEO|nr:uncharacterized protein BDR25DRAFT_266666 [Lindgomyces ingoldianus]KAF2467677.1 hypothetical protein BDR25DRAFT_266666 [Lindgomyces ingoldianus]
MPIWKRSRSSSEAGIDPTFRYETSWLLSPSVLFILRALFSLYAFTTIFTIFGYNNSHGQSENSRHSFSFFTNLTYWGLAFYYAFAALHTGSYWLKGQPFLSSWPRPLQLAHGMFYSTIVIFPFIVTIVYWALLYSGHFTDAFTTWSNTSQHALNSVYALFEIVFPRTKPLPFLHLIVIIVILALYLGLAYLTYATDDYFVYDFLDSTTNSPEKVAGYIIGILVAAVIIFLIIRYLIMLRVWFTEKPGRTGEFTTHRGVSLEEEAEKGNTMHDVSAK